VCIVEWAREPAVTPHAVPRSAVELHESLDDGAELESTRMSLSLPAPTITMGQWLRGRICG
jgi:hypothetical protein